MTVHRTDCINIINLPEEERARLIDAEWQHGSTDRVNKACIWQRSMIYGHNRTGLLVDITKIFTERKIDVNSVNSRTSKQGLATIAMAFEVPDKAVLQLPDRKDPPGGECH